MILDWCGGYLTVKSSVGYMYPACVDLRIGGLKVFAGGT